MVDPVELETNVLEFLRKSFMFARSHELAGREVAIFQRTETETESKFRPKILRLFLVIPTDWVLYDLAGEMLVLGRDGRTPGPRAAGTAVEAGAEGAEFDEQGIRFHRRPVGSGWLYAPAELDVALEAPGTLGELGIGPPDRAER